MGGLTFDSLFATSHRSQATPSAWPMHRLRTLLPPLFHGSCSTIAHEGSGQIILSGVVLCVSPLPSTEPPASPRNMRSQSKKSSKQAKRTSPSQGIARISRGDEFCFAFGLDPERLLVASPRLSSSSITGWTSGRISPSSSSFSGRLPDQLVWSHPHPQEPLLRPVRGASASIHARPAPAVDHSYGLGPTQYHTPARATAHGPAHPYFNYLFRRMAGVICIPVLLLLDGQTRWQVRLLKLGAHMASIIHLATLWDSR